MSIQETLLDSEWGAALNHVSEIEIEEMNGAFEKLTLHLKTGGHVEGFGETPEQAGIDALKQVAALNPVEGDRAATEETNDA